MSVLYDVNTADLFASLPWWYFSYFSVCGFLLVHPAYFQIKVGLCLMVKTCGSEWQRWIASHEDDWRLRSPVLLGSEPVSGSGRRMLFDKFFFFNHRCVSRGSGVFFFCGYLLTSSTLVWPRRSAHAASKAWLLLTCLTNLLLSSRCV